MPKASLLTEDDRDQLLKEMAFGIPLKELSEKFNLKPIQIEYQRGNNSALYNMYLDYFCIKEEIVMMELPELYQFVLNILWDKIKVMSNGRYLYKNKLYKITELIPFANEILKREGLPLVEIGKPVRVRYSSKRDVCQQINKIEILEVIEKFNSIVETMSHISSNNLKRKPNILEVLSGVKFKRVNWKNCIVVEEEQEVYLPLLKLWYRILTEGRSRPRGRPLGELNVLFDILNSFNMLSSNWSEITLNEKGEVHFSYTGKISEPFEFKGFSICKRVENFINTYGIGADYKFFPILCHVGARLDEEFIKNNDDVIRNFIDTLFEKDEEYISELLNTVSSKRLGDDIITIFNEV